LHFNDDQAFGSHDEIKVIIGDIIYLFKK